MLRLRSDKMYVGAYSHTHCEAKGTWATNINLNTMGINLLLKQPPPFFVRLPTTIWTLPAGLNPRSICEVVHRCWTGPGLSWMRFGVRALRRLYNLIRAKMGTIISKMTSLFAQRDSAAAAAAAEAFPKLLQSIFHS